MAGSGPQALHSIGVRAVSTEGDDARFRGSANRDRPPHQHASRRSTVPPIEYFRRRWRGQVAASTVLWRDTLGVGTVVNLAATLAAFVMASQGVPAWAAVVVHFLPLPYNVFLFVAVRRARPRSRFGVALAAAWLAAMTLV